VTRRAWNFRRLILSARARSICLVPSGCSRLREEAARFIPWPVACERGTRNVSGALIGSALTTDRGLGQNVGFRDFGKFQQLPVRIIRDLFEHRLIGVAN